MNTSPHYESSEPPDFSWCFLNGIEQAQFCLVDANQGKGLNKNTVENVKAFIADLKNLNDQRVREASSNQRKAQYVAPSIWSVKQLQNVSVQKRHIATYLWILNHYVFKVSVKERQQKALEEAYTNSPFKSL
jgi:uncharacterized MAPEG superfamily protein